MNKKELDFTIGNIPKQLLIFSLPLFLTNLLQSFYSIADLLIVGNVVGSAGLTAISNASMLSFILNAICIGLTTGGTVLIAQNKGANHKTGQKETIGTLFTLSAIAATLVTIIGLASYPTVFRLLQIPASAKQDACAYMFIICCGTSLVFGYNTVCAIMRGLGDSKSPLYFVAIATIVNIILDLILVAYCELGTQGAAYATVFSQGLSFLLSLGYFRKKQVAFAFHLKSFAIKRHPCLIILTIGLPSVIQMVVVNLSYLLVTGMLNNYGVAIAAASGIGLKVNTFAGMPCWAIGQAITTMVGQNVGAQKIERIKSITQIGLLLNIGVTLCMVLLVQLFAAPIIALFAPHQQTVIEAGTLYLRICCSINSLIYAMMYTFDSFATGIGAADVAMCNALLDSVIVRLLFSWLLITVAGMDFIGIYIAQALSPLIPALIGYLYFKKKIFT